METNGKKNPTEVKGSDLTAEQIEAASDFLSGANWKTDQPTRETSRVDIVRLLAWYAAVRYQAGVHGIGTLEKPARTTYVLPAPQAVRETEFEILIETDRRFIPMPGTSDV